MAPRRKTLSESDRAEWAAYVRQVAALAGRALPEQTAPPSATQSADATPAGSPATANAARAPAVSRPFLDVGTHPGGLDKSTWTKFRTGRLPSMRTLDLHGRTAQRAYHALQAFVMSAHADGVRCVEVITGRGSGEQGGVLKRELPHWLNHPTLRPLVLAASHPHPANPGSVRLLLRRTR
jgi:DNA-nicking Smr family endonuclease